MTRWPGLSRNLRGSSYDRRARRAHLVATCGVPRKSDGKKTRVACHHCGRLCRASARSWSVDRFPVCGHMGGRYVRGNVVPACRACNESRCRAERNAVCRERVARLWLGPRVRVNLAGSPF